MSPMDRAGSAPRMEYETRLQARRASAARLQRDEGILSGVRLVTAIAGVILGWLILLRGALSPWWLLAPVAAFGVLIVLHERVFRTRRRLQRAAAWYERGIERLEDRWAGHGNGADAGERHLDASHLFAADLDLFGRGSLFERISTVRTRAGEETLAAWLKAPADPLPVRARQECVRELKDRLDLREDLALMGDDLRAGVHPEELSAWGREPPQLGSRAVRVAAAALPLFSVAALAAWGWDWTGPAPAMAALAVQSLLALGYRARVRHVMGGVDAATRDLALLSQVLARLEREPFASTRLLELRARLETGGEPPSRRIARLSRLVELLDARRNQLFTPISYLLLWATQITHAIESWRATSGPAIEGWLEAVGEMEALCALAGYAWENPEDPFPEILDPARGGVFEAEALGHPLIPRARCVDNDVALGGERRLMIVSGSNMSGKSTLLRSVGTNVALAMAGGPVRARRLRLTPLAIGASIRVLDSLQAGTSRFYAEITRLRAIVDRTAGAFPVMFLIDEILHGTNSHDRAIGGEAVVRGLVDRGAIGMVTTHDLALARIVDALGSRALNVHFEDHLEGGRMTFDYILRDGVVRKSNALELMRAVGLEIA